MAMLSTGLQGQIKERLIASSPQLLIEPVNSMTIADADAIDAAARRLGARDIRPTVAGIGWGANEEERPGRPMRIRSGAGAGGGANDIGLTRELASPIRLNPHDLIIALAP